MQDLKVNICCLNSQYIHSSLSPWCLLAGVREYCDFGIKATVVEDTVNNDITEVFINFCKNEPGVFAFCCYIWNIEYVLKVCRMIKEKYPSAVIVLGGPEVSYNAEEILKVDFVDYVISGEGEKPFAMLLNAIKKNKICKETGVCYKENGEIYISEPYVMEVDPPSPFCEEYYNALNGRISYIETSRGCPYSCAFCLSGKCGGVRFFDLEKSKQNILDLSKANTKTIKFVDRTFNANKKRAKEIFRFIIDNYGKEIEEGKCFHFEIAGDILDDETIEILRSAPKGSIQLEIGMQSFNEETLCYINRKTNTKVLRENIKRLTENNNIHIHIDLIAGLPKEGLKSFIDSFNIGFSLNAHMLQLGFLKILHGSPMEEDFKKYFCEYSATPPYEVISTPYISHEELNQLKCAEDAVDKLYNSGRFKRTVKYLLSCGYKPYDLFYEFGSYTNRLGNMSLDRYLEECFAFFSIKPNIDKFKLRDYMLLDRISTNSSGVIPACLKVEDVNLKKAKAFLDSREKTKKQKGIKRTVAKLYAKDIFVFCDYSKKDIISKEYKLNFFDLP